MLRRDSDEQTLEIHQGLSYNGMISIYYKSCEGKLE